MKILRWQGASNIELNASPCPEAAMGLKNSGVLPWTPKVAPLGFRDPLILSIRAI